MESRHLPNFQSAASRPRRFHVRSRATHPGPGGVPLPPQREPAPQQRRQVPQARPQRRGGRLALGLPGARAAAQGAVGRGRRGQRRALARWLHLDRAHGHPDALTAAAAPVAALPSARLRAFTRQREGATAARARDTLPAAAHLRAPGPGASAPRTAPAPPRCAPPRPAAHLWAARTLPPPAEEAPRAPRAQRLHRCVFPRILLPAPSFQRLKNPFAPQPGLPWTKIQKVKRSSSLPRFLHSLTPEWSPYARLCKMLPGTALPPWWSP